jgi:hypothetical protein
MPTPFTLPTANNVPPFSVNTVPSGVVPFSAVFHVYVLSLSCTLPSSVFCSHTSPVS